MELPNEKARKEYSKEINYLQADLKSFIDSGQTGGVEVDNVQIKLNKLAKKYEDDTVIGPARYQLYELQALTHYFNNEDGKALAFIEQAIKLKGGSYPKAEKLISRIAEDNKENIRGEKLVGLEGWLALFIVGQFLTLLVTLYEFFASGFLSSTEINTLNGYKSGLGDFFQSITAFENVAIVIAVGLIVTTLVLLFRKNKLAKPFAIATLTLVALYGIIDYAIVSYALNSYDLSQTTEMQSIMSKYSGDVGRNVLSAFVWVPYFLVSKRVKATLTR